MHFVGKIVDRVPGYMSKPSETDGCFPKRTKKLQIAFSPLAFCLTSVTHFDCYEISYPSNSDCFEVE